ncbi:MAG: hypothetical protein GY730_06525 [bacterium]|nr:hypothetical protein [bacterium]
MDKSLAYCRRALQEKLKTLALEKIKVSTQQRKERIENIDLKRKYEPRGLDADLTQAQFRFLQERKKLEKWVKAKGWPLDDSKIDFRVCKKIINSYGEEATKQALIKCSPAIETQHKTWEKYAETTVQKAIQKNREERQSRKKYSRGPQSRM